MPKRSAGILLYRWTGAALDVLLVHPGGPFWRKRDAGAWSIPKGEYAESEEPEAAARRETAEEIGLLVEGELAPLGEVRQGAGKVVTAFTAEGAFALEALVSNSFEMEWPPRSGRMQSFPEVDRAGWFDLRTAREKLIEGQRPLLDRFAALLRAGEG
jgi:predicted NUDIX family NTP pyrophosphohydrolase